MSQELRLVVLTLAIVYFLSFTITLLTAPQGNYRDKKQKILNISGTSISIASSLTLILGTPLYLLCNLSIN